MKLENDDRPDSEVAMHSPRTAKNGQLQNARILIVDDQEDHVRQLQQMLEAAGYSKICTVVDPRSFLTVYLDFRPDLIMLDIFMPWMNGYEILEQLEPRIATRGYLPILGLTGDHSPETRHKALSMGAMDFVVKPFDPVEVLLRIRNLLETRFLHLQLHNQNQILEEKVQQRTRELEEERLARVAEFRDDWTGQHTERVGKASALLAEALGLPQEQINLIRRAAPLHDVGKIGIPDSILLKPGKLTSNEFEFMKNHTLIGARILTGSRFPLLQLAEEIALTHHERWDGEGYNHLKQDSTPLASRIVAVTDAFDALTHDRPYRMACSVEDAMREIENERGRQFDPWLVDIFLGLVPGVTASWVDDTIESCLAEDPRD